MFFPCNALQYSLKYILYYLLQRYRKLLMKHLFDDQTNLVFSSYKKINFYVVFSMHYKRKVRGIFVKQQKRYSVNTAPF
jgi:hypothetical protein